MQNQDWHPKVGEYVTYQPLRKKRGLLAPPQRVLVVAHHLGGTYSVKFHGGRSKAVRIKTLSPA